MSTFSVYRRDTGEIVKHFIGSPRQLSINVPDGHSAVPGRHDALAERIDDATGATVDWQPPRPDDHDWSESQRRWLPNAALLRKRAALEEIRRLERNQQPRALREAVLGHGTERLQQIEAEIAELRGVLTPTRSDS